MTGGARRFGWVVVLGLAFGLAGCAAGAPASVVPAPAEVGQVAFAPVLTPIAVSDAPAAVAGEGAEAEATAPAAPAEVAAEASETEPAVPDSIAVSAASAGGALPDREVNGTSVPAGTTTDAGLPAQDSAAAGVPKTDEVVAPAFASALDSDPVADQASGPEGPLPAPAAEDVALPAAAPGSQESGRPPAPPADGSGVSQLIEGHADGRKEVALTFDAGADRGYAEAILDLLRDEGIKATFGMTGSWAEQNPDLIQRMVAEGHQLINHTWSHGSMTGANTGQPAWTYEQLADELARTEQIIRDLTGYELKPYYRPPYGDYDLDSLGYLADLGYPFTIMWTCDTQGWRGWGAEQILEYCTQVPLEDDIILMHVGASAAGDYEVLPSMIAWYRTNGYAFVTAEQMLQP